MSSRLRPGRGWVPALRVARREATRARGRSVLVLFMIALPVLGVTAADVVIQTSKVSGAEAVERRLGTSDARIGFDPGVTHVAQRADPDADGWSSDYSRKATAERGLADVEEVLGRDVTGTVVAQGSKRVTTAKGLSDVEVVEVDLTDDLTDGLYRIDEGRVPVTQDEVVVNSALAARGFGLGDPLEVAGGATLTVVGIGDNASYRGYPIAVAPPGAFDLPEQGGQVWLVDTGGDVTWDQVRALNDVGALVLSRAVLLDPPPTSALDPDVMPTGGSDDALIAVIALIAVMALIEVVLLAGPAFAVIARRMQRSLALMAASGATPPQARRVVLASGVVLGTAGAALGVGLGLVVAWLSLPLVQRFSDDFLGPYDVPWLHLLGIAGFGLLSALLAAVVPAWIASRQDIVAVLAGRRGDRRPSLRSPLLGLVLLGVGIGISAWGATSGQGGEFAIALAAIVAVLGMILLVPVVVTGVARLGRSLPLPMRYAARDAARHRARTVPAVAAVAATVAGVVALGIANASDAAEREATYTEMLEVGQASLTAYGKAPDWAAYQAAAERFLPDADVTPIMGVSDSGRRYTEVDFAVDGQQHVLAAYGSSLGTSVPISVDGRVPAGIPGLDDTQRAEAERVLADGGVLVFSDTLDSGEEATVTTRVRQPGPDPRGSVTVPAVVIRVSTLDSTFLGVLSAPVADELGIEPTTVGLLVDGARITEAQEADVTEALATLSSRLSFYVERGYQDDDATVILLLVLGALGAVLMLGGTLTATFLSLSDARPDLATLAAVGASPRTRRAVAASYAVVIGLVGAAMGAVVGFIPGIAITYPLTSTSWIGGSAPGIPDHFLDVPWLLVASLVLVLPLLTAAVVGATTRSRLPLVARID